MGRRRSQLPIGCDKKGKTAFWPNLPDYSNPVYNQYSPSYSTPTQHSHHLSTSGVLCSNNYFSSIAAPWYISQQIHQTYDCSSQDPTTSPSLRQILRNPCSSNLDCESLDIQAPAFLNPLYRSSKNDFQAHQSHIVNFEVAGQASLTPWLDQNATILQDDFPLNGSIWLQATTPTFNLADYMKNGLIDNYSARLNIYDGTPLPLQVEGAIIEAHDLRTSNPTLLDQNSRVVKATTDLFSISDTINVSQASDKSVKENGSSNKSGIRRLDKSYPERTINANLTSLKDGKPRLVCHHPGCKATFRRNYELGRHHINIHTRTINLLCPIYQCSRTGKPYHRLDKFNEHVRKHGNSVMYLCLMENCHIEPCTKAQLIKHLATEHYQDHSSQPNFDDVFKAINLDPSIFKLEKLRFAGRDTCPLKCGFQLSHEELDLKQHLVTHELVDRSKGHGAIKAAGFEPSFGVTTCPLCKKQNGHGYVWIDKRLLHLSKDHTRSERAISIAELSRILSPWMQEHSGGWFMGIAEELYAEVRESLSQQKLSS